MFNKISKSFLAIDYLYHLNHQRIFSRKDNFGRSQPIIMFLFKFFFICQKSAKWLANLHVKTPPLQANNNFWSHWFCNCSFFFLFLVCCKDWLLSCNIWLVGCIPLYLRTPIDQKPRVLAQVHQSLYLLWYWIFCSDRFHLQMVLTVVLIAHQEKTSDNWFAVKFELIEA